MGYGTTACALCHRTARQVPRIPMRRGRRSCCRRAFSALRCCRRFQIACSAFSLGNQEKRGYSHRCTLTVLQLKAAQVLSENWAKDREPRILLMDLMVHGKCFLCCVDCLDSFATILLALEHHHFRNNSQTKLLQRKSLPQPANISNLARDSARSTSACRKKKTSKVPYIFISQIYPKWISQFFVVQTLY